MFIDTKPNMDARGLTSAALAASKERRKEFTENPLFEGQHGKIPQSILIADRKEMCRNRDLSLSKMGGSAG